jgi:hypothetical protein
MNKSIEEIGGAMKNGKSRDTGNIRHKAQNVDKQNKKYYTENKKMSNWNPSKNNSQCLVFCAVLMKIILCPFVLFLILSDFARFVASNFPLVSSNFSK